MAKIIKSLTVDSDLRAIIEEEKPDNFSQWAGEYIKKGYAASKNPNKTAPTLKNVGVEL